MGRGSGFVPCPCWLGIMERCIRGAGPKRSGWTVSLFLICFQLLGFKFLAAPHHHHLRLMRTFVTVRGLRIIREGGNYYLVYQGKIQRYLGSRTQKRRIAGVPSTSRDQTGEGPTLEEISSRGILDRILFFIGDLEVASMEAKRSRVS